MHNCREKLVRLANMSWLAISLLIASLFGKHDESVCIWTGSYLGFPFKHQLLFKAHFILLSLHRSYCPQNELNTPYPDANLTEITSDLLSFCSFLCKISVCYNFVFTFGYLKVDWQFFLSAGCLRYYLRKIKKISLLCNIEDHSKYKLVIFQCLKDGKQ